MQPRVTLCSVCHAQMPVGQTLCRNCGSMLCPQCRELLPQRSRFCPKCGYLCVVEQPIVTSSVPPSGRPQPMSISRPAIPIPQPAPASFAQTPVVSPVAQTHRNCPKCGSAIDYEQGRCTGCGLLYGTRHRVMQPSTPLPRPLTPHAQASWPQGAGLQQPLPVNPAPQYGGPSFSAPPPQGYHPNYLPAAAMPQPGQLIPIPRLAPNLPGTMASTAMPSRALVPARPFQQQAPPPPPTKRRSAAPGKGGLSGFAIAMIVIVALCLVGGGVYYFSNQEEQIPPLVSRTEPSDTAINPVSNSALRILDVSVQSTTETGATIKWITDQPSKGRIEVRDANGTVVTTQSVDSSAEKQSVTVSGLQPGTKYYYTVTTVDASGKEVTSEGEIITRAVADQNPPVISAAAVSNITESSAIITWLTDEPAKGWVKYFISDNTTSRTGTSTTPEETNLDTTHSIMLTKLNSGTIYTFTILSKDQAGNESTLDGVSFTTQSPIPVAAEVGSRAPNFDLRKVPTGAMKLGDFKGKIVVLNFWAVWCDACVEELPYMQAVSDNWSGNDLVVLAVADNKDETVNTVGEFISEKGYSFRVLYDSAGEAKNLYNITMWPTTFFIDKNGIIKKIQVGSFENQAQIENILSTMR